MSQFEKINAEREENAVSPMDRPRKPSCLKCGDYGFTNCRKAHNPTGWFPAIALQAALACICPAGREFGQWQMEWHR
jgi:predicted amidohydrolase